MMERLAIEKPAVGRLGEWSVVGENGGVALCNQDVRGARVGGESNRWPIDSEDAMVGQFGDIEIGMVVGIGIGIGIGIGS